MRRTTSISALLVVGLLASAVLMATLTSAQPPQPAPARKVYTNSVIPLPATGPAPHGLVVNKPIRDHKKDKMEVLFSLAIPKEAQAKLEEKILKGEVVQAKELQKDYSPKAEDVKRLKDWLEKEGFEITSTSTDKT